MMFGGKATMTVLRRLLSRAALGVFSLWLVAPVSYTVAAGSPPAIRVEQAIVLARQAASTVQTGQAGTVTYARLQGHEWQIRLVGGRALTPCPTPGTGPQHPCDPVPMWTGAEVMIDARTGRAVRVSALHFAGLAPAGGVQAERALRTALKREQRLSKATRLQSYVSAVRYGFLTSFGLSVSCSATVCNPNGLYWDVSFSGLRIRSGAGVIKSHFDVVIDALKGDVVLTTSSK
jgi:hypothetical protein